MKSGTPGAGRGAEAEADIWPGAVAGNVQATSVETGTDRLFWEAFGAAVTGSDWASVVAGVTQQSIGLQPQPHLRTALAGRKDIWADATT